MRSMERLLMDDWNVGQEMVQLWKEKFLEEKWLLNYLTSDEINKVLNNYKYYQGSLMTGSDLRVFTLNK